MLHLQFTAEGKRLRMAMVPVFVRDLRTMQPADAQAFFCACSRGVTAKMRRENDAMRREIDVLASSFETPRCEAPQDEAELAMRVSVAA
jgi:hypothetical protein